MKYWSNGKDIQRNSIPGSKREICRIYKRLIFEASLILGLTTMKSTSCLVCQKKFTRPDNLKRHMRIAHGTNQPYPQNAGVLPQTNPPPPPLWKSSGIEGTPPPPPPPRKSSGIEETPPPPTRKSSGNVETFKFVHPFTMIVAGPTMSGKSTWIKNLC